MSGTDILSGLERLWVCRRCQCYSCEDGYENHSHRCTDGPGCVESRERLKANLEAISIIASRAGQEIKRLRDEVERLTVVNSLGDGI